MFVFLKCDSHEHLQGIVRISCEVVKEVVKKASLITSNNEKFQSTMLKTDSLSIFSSERKL